MKVSLQSILGALPSLFYDLPSGGLTSMSITYPLWELCVSCSSTKAEVDTHLPRCFSALRYSRKI